MLGGAGLEETSTVPDVKGSQPRVTGQPKLEGPGRNPARLLLHRRETEARNYHPQNLDL